MMQARKWGLATLNEFRKFFGLKPHETFESVNSDPVVADHLRHLYDHPDYIEMYRTSHYPKLLKHSLIILQRVWLPRKLRCQWFPVLELRQHSLSQGPFFPML